MVFSSVIFLVYFLPLVLIIYYLLPNKLKNYFLLLASIFFYSWGAPLFIFVILLTTTIDYYLVKIMSNSETEQKRKLFLVLSLSLNLGLLFYFKYCNFFVDNLNHLFSLFNISELKWLKVVLPIGISFYTFESVTYVVDVYRKEHKPLSNFLNYQLYILFFPKLIAGPIIRYSQISNQITDRFKTFGLDQILNGFCRFVIGLGKKVLLANTMGFVADQVFSGKISYLSSSACWIGAIAYTFQIYFDFSGYSDMAIGLGKMFGFRFPENFNNPYTSKSVTEFWRRWHMTLGSWMKNYLYIPLGGNKVNSKYRLFFNLWLVFILSGFWHGASWTFIIWGAYFGFWLILERLFLANFFKKLGGGGWILTFFIVVIGWVFFRANDLTHAKEFLSRMFHYPFISGANVTLTQKELFYLALCIVFSFFTLIPSAQKIQDYIFSKENKSFVPNFAIILLCICIYLLALASITSSKFNPFIYFRF